MAEYIVVTKADVAEPFAPPGLLISFGDGSAREVTEEMLAGWIKCGTDEPTRADREIAKYIIQQAQEARDV